MSSSNSFFTKIFIDAKVRSIVFFGFVRYLPTPELKIFIGIVHWRQSQEYERKNKKREKGEQILSNFRQNQQCSLP
jgi:hypothetical protein